MTLRVAVGALSDVGRVRDHNEDGYLIDQDLGLLAVADGMGGHRGGEVASATALEVLQRTFAEGQDLGAAVRAANDAVFERSVADDAVRGMGTTLTALALDDGQVVHVGHVGDSRAYLWRDATLLRLTTDHSLVEELMAAGELTPEEAERDPRRSMITRALGLEPGVEVDLFRLDLHQGDRLLVCSDGLTTMIREADAAAILADEDDPIVAAQRLVDAANSAGGTDNTTVLVIDILDTTGTGADLHLVDEPDEGLPEAQLVDDGDDEPSAPDPHSGRGPRRWPFRHRR